MDHRAKSPIAVLAGVLVLGLVFLAWSRGPAPRKDVRPPASVSRSPVTGRAAGRSPPPSAPDAAPAPTGIPAGEDASPRSGPAAPGGRGWVIAGRIVRDAAPGSERGAAGAGAREPATVPAEGAAVLVRPHPRKTKPAEASPVQKRVTGPDGRFEFAGVPGNVWLRIEIDEPASAYRALSFRFDDPSGDGRKDLGDLRVEPGGTLVVQLIGPRGEPAERGTVLANRTSADPDLSARGLSESRREAEERGNGVYVLDRAPLGPLNVGARAPGYSPSETNAVELPREKPLVIRLGAGSAIAGWVLSPQGPIAGADLEASGGSDPFTAKTDGAGRFAFDGLGEGEYTVSASAEGFVSARTSAKTGTEDLEFVLDPEAMFAGKVVSDEDGRPVAGARITLRLPDPESPAFDAASDAGGSFAVRKVPEGVYTAIVDHPDFAPRILEPRELRANERVDAGTIRLERGFSATGTVVDSKTEDPIPGATVSFGLRWEGRVVARRVARTDSGGTFEARGIGEGSHLLSGEADRHLRKEEQVELTLDGEREFWLALDPGFQLVIGGQGLVLRGLTVQSDGGGEAGGEGDAGNVLILGGEGAEIEIQMIDPGDGSPAAGGEPGAAESPGTEGADRPGTGER